MPTRSASALAGTAPTPTNGAPAPTRAAATSSPARARAAHPPVRPASEPWVLGAARLVLHAGTFRGPVTVRTAGGTVRALELTVRSLDATRLDVTMGRGSTALRLSARPATTSTLRGEGGDRVVTLYIRRLSGTVESLGGAPLPVHRTVTITPDAVPRWLSHPAVPGRTLIFDGVTVRAVAQFGGTLSITGPRLRVAAG
ncbi:hypothetical protein [Streptomyces sp. NPDC020362]|uniref:hypothetical protein n=1 Tax=unclassified Streptomyces TaxID=2593676 RepID=UPI0033D61B5D